MNYEQAVNTKISEKEAKHEIELHGLDFNDFLIDSGLIHQVK